MVCIVLTASSLLPDEYLSDKSQRLHNLYDCVSLYYEVCMSVCVCVLLIQASRGPADQCVREEKTSDTCREQERRSRCCDNPR